MLDQGDTDGFTVWLKVVKAIEPLQRKGPGDASRGCWSLAKCRVHSCGRFRLRSLNRLSARSVPRQFSFSVFSSSSALFGNGTAILSIKSLVPNPGSAAGTIITGAKSGIVMPPLLAVWYAIDAVQETQTEPSANTLIRTNQNSCLLLSSCLCRRLPRRRRSVTSPSLSN